MAEPVTLARPYAKAAFDAAKADNKLPEWQQQLNTAAAVASNDKVSAVLSSPALTAEQQVKLLLDLCGDALNAKGQNLIHVLASNKRLPLLPAIAVQFAELKAQQEKATDVEVTSAFLLEPAVADRLAQSLGKKWQCEVKLHTQVDASLLGGVVIKAGDTVIDASVRGRMLKLADALIA